MNLRNRLNLARRIYSLTVQLRAKSSELHAAHRRIAALTEGRPEDADLRAADARISDLTDQLAEAGRAHRSALDQITGLQKQLAEYALKNVVAHRIVDQHHQVSALPPALTRDRQALSRMEDELAESRVWIETCRREHAGLKEGNPS